jgi:peptidyl-tRNA hydrolase, PTH1 family
MTMIFKNLFRRKHSVETKETTVIVGLGNPGIRYRTTRHNAGFLAIDFLREHFGLPEFESERKFRALVSTGNTERGKLLLVKPETYMNESGESVRGLLDFYKLTPASLIVIHDDVDIAPGKMKQTAASSSAGHNGVENIIDRLGTKDFMRFRLGIGRPPEPGKDTASYVLEPFSSEDLVVLRALFPELAEKIQQR